MTKKKKTVTDQLSEDKQLIEYKTQGVVLMTQEELDRETSRLFVELNVAKTLEEEDKIAEQLALLACSVRIK